MLQLSTSECIILFQLRFRHQRTSSSKSAASARSLGALGRGVITTAGDSPSAADFKFTSPSSSSNKELLEEGPQLNFGGIYIIQVHFM